MEENNNLPNANPNTPNTIYNLTRNKRVLIAITFVLLFIATLFFMVVSSSFNRRLSPTPSPITTAPSITTFPLPTIPSSQRLNQIQKTAPGEFINLELLEKQKDYLSKEIVDENNQKFSFKSEILPRPNIVLVSPDSKVLFERLILPSDRKSLGYATLSEIKTKRGEAERVIKGSKFYDWAIETHIYASKGFAVIVNPKTNEVYEMHFFNPSSIEVYIQTYGEDLNPQASPPVEGAR